VWAVPAVLSCPASWQGRFSDHTAQLGMSCSTQWNCVQSRLQPCRPCAGHYFVVQQWQVCCRARVLLCIMVPLCGVLLKWRSYGRSKNYQVCLLRWGFAVHHALLCPVWLKWVSCHSQQCYQQCKLCGLWHALSCIVVASCSRLQMNMCHAAGPAATSVWLQDSVSMRAGTPWSR
jgi:hypothetical protein